MQIFRGFSFSLLLLTGVSSSLVAQTQSVMEQIQVPNCLASRITSNYSVLAENQSFKIIEVAAADLDDISRLADRVACGRFVNVSHRLQQGVDNKITQARLIAQLNKPLIRPGLLKNQYKISHSSEVNASLTKVSSTQVWDYLTNLTNFTNRSATKDTGVAAAQWIKDTVEKVAAENGRKDVATYFVATGRYKQPSLVTVIGKSIQAPAVVVGAHMDTLDGYMPGAGDDGSGSAALLEMTRALLSETHDFKRPVYVIWYAAEERGLVGSQYVVEDFLRKKIPVYTVVQFDMAGYRTDPKDPSMWVFRDYTDSTLNTFVADLIKTYIKVPVKYSQCGYGCSDHVSWMEEGIPAAFPCETSYEDHNPTIHTSNDSLSLINQEHLTNFTKLALAYVLELSLG